MCLKFRAGSLKGLSYIWQLFFHRQGVPGGNPGRGLWRQCPLQLCENELLIGFGLGVASEDEFAPVGHGEVHVKHLDGSEFVERLSGGEAGGTLFELMTQRKLHAVGERKHTKMCASMRSSR